MVDIAVMGHGFYDHDLIQRYDLIIYDIRIGVPWGYTFFDRHSTRGYRPTDQSCIFEIAMRLIRFPLRMASYGLVRDYISTVRGNRCSASRAQSR